MPRPSPAKIRTASALFGVTLLGLLIATACSAEGSGSAASGGKPSSGGSTGGANASSGGSHGGAAPGTASGGITQGSGGGSTGGNPTGGSATSGGGSGGAQTGGAAGTSGGTPGSTSGGNSTTGGTSGSTSGGGAASGCETRSDLLFCEDFEKGSANAAPSGAMWTTSYIGPDVPRIVIDGATPAHSGKQSASVNAPLSNFQSFLIYHDAAVLPRASGEFYLRVWVRLGRAMADHHNAYLVLDRAASAGSGAAVRLGEQANMLSLTVGGDAHGSLSNQNFSNDQALGAHFVSETWGCLEGYFNSKTPEIDFWLDNREIADFHHKDWPADAYDAVRLGFEKYAGPELSIWFDDFAISSARIGCQ
ncbi:MAG TPA: hypothetical protein VG937_12720 [Polyangiaceae bacterium]|nr:hypothetical protein [Polyangiaceae bacterium]